MPPLLGQKLGALLGAGSNTGVGLAVGANGLAALAIGAFVGARLDVSVGWALALVAASFVLLTTCLLSPRMVWVAAVLGAAVNAAICGFISAAISEAAHPLAPWVAGPLGVLIGAGGTLWAYRDAARIARTAGDTRHR